MTLVGEDRIGGNIDYKIYICCTYLLVGQSRILKYWNRITRRLYISFSFLRYPIFKGSLKIIQNKINYWLVAMETLQVTDITNTLVSSCLHDQFVNSRCVMKSYNCIQNSTILFVSIIFFYHMGLNILFVKFIRFIFNIIVSNHTNIVSRINRKYRVLSHINWLIKCHDYFFTNSLCQNSYVIHSHDFNNISLVILKQKLIIVFLFSYSSIVWSIVYQLYIRQSLKL